MDIDEEKGLEFEAQFQSAMNCKQNVIPIIIFENVAEEATMSASS